MKRTLLHKTLIATGLLFVVAYFVFSVCFFTSKKTEVICNRLEINFIHNNINLIDENGIEKILMEKRLYPVGKKLNEIRTEAIEKILIENEMIKSVECYATPSGIIYIQVKQRTPKFRVIGSENYYVGTDKKKIKVSTNYTAYLPVVSGDVSFEMATGELFHFISFLEKNSFWNAQIQQIHVRSDKKIELVPRVGESIILLGTLDNYPSKLEKLKKLYMKAFNEIGWNRYKTIDLQYKGQIVCTRID